MNGKLEPQKIRGQIKRIELSGFGPNSGELTLTIGPPGNKGENYFAGIIDQGGASDSIEHGVFAGYKHSHLGIFHAVDRGVHVSGKG